MAHHSLYKKINMHMIATRTANIAADNDRISSLKNVHNGGGREDDKTADVTPAQAVIPERIVMHFNDDQITFKPKPML